MIIIICGGKKVKLLTNQTAYIQGWMVTGWKGVRVLGWSGNGLSGGTNNVIIP